MREMFSFKRLSVEKPYLLGVIFFVILVGVSSGIFFERCLPSDDKSAAFGAIESIFFTDAKEPTFGFFETFLAYTKSSFVSLLFVYISTVVVFLTPAIGLLLVFNGFSLGFTATLLIDYFDLKGQILIIATVIPFCLINLVIFSLATAASLEYLRTLIGGVGQLNGRNKKRVPIGFNMDTPLLADNIKDFSYKMLYIFVIALALNFIQSFLCLLVG